METDASSNPFSMTLDMTFTHSKVARTLEALLFRPGGGLLN